MTLPSPGRLALQSLADALADEHELAAEAFIDAALNQPSRLAALARLYGAARGLPPPPPFDDPDWPPSPALPLPALPSSGASRGGPEGKGRRRSVVFIGHSYYNFLHLAAALRRRGWDALSVNVLDDMGADTLLHGCDLDLFSADGATMTAGLRAFAREAPRRFGMAHFYGKGRLALFPDNSGVTGVPWDVLALKSLGMRIGYSTYGCQDGVSQSSFDRWSEGRCCSVCVWRDDPAACGDALNLVWGRRLRALTDLFCIEGDAALDHKYGAALYRDPLTCALDPETWRPDLEIPDRWRRPRAADEVVILHGVGNYDLRTRAHGNVKGTPHIVAAVEALRRKGLPVRLDLVSGAPSSAMRFIQAQADIVVEQVLYGRHGATAREAAMLGKPTVVLMNPYEEAAPGISALARDCPLVSAGPADLETALEALVRSPERRAAVGRASRAWAMRWWSADACAERYEAVYDRLMAGEPLEEPPAPGTPG